MSTVSASIIYSPHQFLDSFSNYVMNTCYGLGVVLDAGDTKVSQTGHKASWKTGFLVRNKQRVYHMLMRRQEAGKQRRASNVVRNLKGKRKP